MVGTTPNDDRVICFPTRAARAARPLVFCLAFLATVSVAAQDGPPRPDGDPSPAAFFPLQLGSVFDYTDDTGHLLRRTVAYDTLVGPTRYAVVADTTWDRAGQPVGVARYAARFDPETSRVVVWDGDRERLSPALAPCPMTAGPEVVCAAADSTRRRLVTEGMGVLALAPGLSVRTRTYASEVGFDVLVLAEGFGPVLVADLHNVYSLRYARVGGRELGVPSRSVHTEASAPPPLRLRVWPNPTVGRVTLRYEGGAGDASTADVFDALGRRVLSVPLPAGGDVRQVVLDLPGALSRGVYTVRVGGTGGATVRFVRQ